MEKTEKNKYSNNARRIFHFMVTLLGVLVFLYSLFEMQYARLDLNFVFIAILTLTLGSRVAINFQIFKSNISVVDVLIYLVGILYGVEAATCLVAIEAYLTSARFTKSIEIKSFNVGISSVSIFIAFNLCSLFLGSLSNIIQIGLSLKLIGAASLMIILHYLLNSSIVSISTALRDGKSAFKIWREYYVWMFIPFFASGSVALVTANTIQTSGFYAFFTILPIIAIIYFGYHSQHGKLEAVTEQISQAKRHLIEMTESEARFRSAFSNAPIGIALMSNEGQWLQANQALCRIFGCSEDEFLTKNLQNVIHAEDLTRILSRIDSLIQGNEQSFQTEIRFHNEQGNELWTQTSISSLKDSENSRLICQIQDITARKIAEDKLRHDAFYDSLTGLANRTMLVNNLNTAISGANNEYAVIFIDLDRFKLINDSMGHSVGDRLLIEVSQRISNCLPSTSTLARLGGDEFIVVTQAAKESLEINDLVHKIQNRIAPEFLIDGHQIKITASFGIVFNEPLHQTAEDILRDAGTALHLAKLRGRSNYVFFDNQMREKANNQMQLENDLKKAVERNELFLVYQPIIALEDKHLVGFEALIRWQHPKLGLVSPLEFISIAEENGTIIEIGQFVLDESCRQIKRWQTEFSQALELTISVNVSPKQLLQKNLFATVVGILEKHKVKPNQIKLEITESVVVENSELVTSILKQFRAIGVKLSMDDFGTGYSSLSYLHQLPIDTLKIDRSFISQMTDEAESAEIVRTILLLAKNLKLDVVAEGIETGLQHETLRDLHCEFGQGYHFSKPLSVADAKSYIENSHSEFDFTHIKNLDQISSFIEH